MEYSLYLVIYLKEGNVESREPYRWSLYSTAIIIELRYSSTTRFIM